MLKLKEKKGKKQLTINIVFYIKATFATLKDNSLDSIF